MTEPDVDLLRLAIASQLGLAFDDAKRPMLAELLRQRSAARGVDPATYVSQLGPNVAELGVLARDLTVGETYFFRNSEQFRAFAAVVLPDRRQAAGRRPLSVLSAGCASGDEPYTIAIVARVAGELDVAIRAVDVNPAALERAARARFSTWALRETPEDVRGTWFTPDGRDLALDPAIRAMVRFEQRNLAAADPELWPRGGYDAIFCRNVLMYFTPEMMRAAVDRMASALAPGGYLFLGHAETLRGVSNAFHLCHTHDTFYYQRRGDGERAEPPVAPTVQRTAPELAEAVAAADSWVDAIHQASERIRALADTHVTIAARAPRSEGARLGEALDLLRRERFADALGALDALPGGADRDPDVLLLRAVVLAHHGQLAAAEGTADQLLGIDELNAGAHYVLALCRESGGDTSGAIDHDQVAIYLDPSFAMPRLHLGLIARRAGDRATARRELEQALLLLEREDASRLLLFGGGFQRDALLALCRAELTDGRR